MNITCVPSKDECVGLFNEGRFFEDGANRGTQKLILVIVPLGTAFWEYFRR
jgi:hypothetical protein